KIAVIYSGQLMEHASTQNILELPHHPYTQSLLSSVPMLGKRHSKGSRLFTLDGNIPPIDRLPVGCRLGPRCPTADKVCVKPPQLKSIANHGKVRCHIIEPVSKTKNNKSRQRDPKNSKECN
ncbi:MAG: hypothetical protein L3J46_09950, partial [Kangiellaceae bacterium]|nr:hypothetical protein [Kangiellaceae bacterium]